MLGQNPKLQEKTIFANFFFKKKNLLLLAESGRLVVSLSMGLTEKRVTAGDQLDDDRWHTVRVDRRGMLITVAVDDEKPVVGEELRKKKTIYYCSRYIFERC